MNEVGGDPKGDGADACRDGKFNYSLVADTSCRHVDITESC